MNCSILSVYVYNGRHIHTSSLSCICMTIADTDILRATFVLSESIVLDKLTNNWVRLIADR